MRPLLFLAIAAAAFAQPPQLPYAPPVNYATGAAPDGIVTADFNGDGLPDLVVVNQADNTFSYLQGVVGGTFNPAVAFSMAGATSILPTVAVAGDFNNDGHPDIAVVHNGSPGIITVHLGDGHGGFATPGIIFSTVSGPTSIAAADFNLDGSLDLAAGSCQTGSVIVHKGGGDGTFNTILSQFFVAPCSGGTVALLATDFNKDSKPDLAVAVSSANLVEIFLNSGTGSFNPAVSLTVTGLPDALAMCDFNNDGSIDVATANLSGDTASVFLGNGTGLSFSHAADVAVGAAPTDITMVDFTNDFHTDLLTVNSGANTVSALLGDGTGQFPNRIDFGTGTTPMHAVTADFNGDGVPDIAVTNSGSNNVSVLLSAAVCATVTISPTSQTFPTSGGTGAISVTANGCGWTAVSNSSFITITSGSSGTGNGTVEFSVAAGTGARTGTITVSGQTFTVTQTGSTCTVSLIPEEQVFGHAGGSGSLTAQVSGGCSISAISNQPWLTAGPVSGSKVNFMVAANATPNVRIAELNVAGETFTLVQTESASGGLNNDSFLYELYGDVLSRPPDTGGLGYYLNALDDFSLTPSQIAVQFLTGPEFAAGGLFVADLYPVLLARTADYGGWLFNTSELHDGLDSQNALINAFLATSEFASKYGNPDNGDFVTLLYNNALGRAPDTGGYNYYLNELNGGTSRAQVVQQFLGTSEFRQDQGNQIFVDTLYLTLLRRTPDASGVSHWTDELNSGALTEAGVVQAFLTSPEYLARF